MRNGKHVGRTGLHHCQRHGSLLQRRGGIVIGRIRDFLVGGIKHHLKWFNTLNYCLGHEEPSNLLQTRFDSGCINHLQLVGRKIQMCRLLWAWRRRPFLVWRFDRSHKCFPVQLVGSQIWLFDHHFVGLHILYIYIYQSTFLRVTGVFCNGGVSCNGGVLLLQQFPGVSCNGCRCLQFWLVFSCNGCRFFFAMVGC